MRYTTTTDAMAKNNNKKKPHTPQNMTPSNFVAISIHSIASAWPGTWQHLHHAACDKALENCSTTGYAATFLASPISDSKSYFCIDKLNMKQFFIWFKHNFLRII